MTATRIRVGTYGVRKPINWRVRKDIHEELTAAAVARGSTSTALVISMIETAMGKPIGKTQIAKLRRITGAGDAVSVTLRLDPSFADALSEAASAAGVSVNRYVSAVVYSALHPKG